MEDMEKTEDKSFHETGNGDLLRKKAEWLSTRIDESIAKVEEKANKFKRYSSLIKITTIIFGGFITLFLGLKMPEYENMLKTMAFSLGAFVTVLNGLEPFFNFRSLWVECEEAEYRFRRLKDDYTFYLFGLKDIDIDIVTLHKFEKTFQETWDQLSTKWLSYRRSINDKN